MYSSVYFARSTSSIHYWEYNERGRKVYKKEPAPLYFFMKDDGGEYKSIYGDILKKVKFSEWYKYKETREMYQAANRTLFESSVAIENRFILDKYSSQEIKIPKLDVYFIDIEVHSEKGFPKATLAEHPITIISVWSTKEKKFYIFTEKEFDKSFITEECCVKIYNNEVDMLKEFVMFIRKLHPDIISGWNSNGYDIPYIINRCYRLLGEEVTNSISPIRQVRKFIKKLRYGKEQEIYDIAGINLIDYLDLYRKYHQGEQESFKLDYIAKVEIGETKLKFEGSLKQLYKENWQKYVEYNVQDVRLLIKIDDRIKFMDLMLSICYNCRVPFQQFDKTTRVLDGAFISRLMLSKVILPDPETNDENEEQYEGAFVLPPRIGIYDWVLSFDATSLYPSIMMQHNISPETKVCVLNPGAIHIVCDCLEGKDISTEELNKVATPDGKTCEEIIKTIKEKKYTISSNGVLYRHDIPGVVASFVKEWFDKRKYHKKLKEEAIKKGDKAEEQKQDALQFNYKILINSVYGVLGSRYFRLYDRDNALAVTQTGQEVIKLSIDSINTFFREQWPNTNIGKSLKAASVPETVIYSDTDSIYNDVGSILKSFNYPHFENNDKCKEFIDKNISETFSKVLTIAMEKLTKNRMNCADCKISFKREMIARRSIFISKKRYVAWGLKMETKDVDEIEAKGVEMVKSSTPELIRDFMSEYMESLLKNVKETTSLDKIKEIKCKFMKAPVQQICKVINVNNIEKYTDAAGNPAKGAPGHVKASICYNNLIKKYDLEDYYELIYEGDKVRIVYIKENPLFPIEAIAFKEQFPDKIKGLRELVDYDIMWEKVFLSPIRSVYDTIKWVMPPLDQEDLSDMFV